MTWIEAFGGLLLVVGSVLVLRAVMAADAVGFRPAVRRRRGGGGGDPGLRRAA